MIYSIAILCCQRYLGIVREEDTLNILLEFVPGGSISSLLGKFGSFPEPVSSLAVLFFHPLLMYYSFYGMTLSNTISGSRL